MLRTDIHQLTGHQNPPSFGNDKLKRFRLSDYLDHPSTHTPPESGQVDLAQVRGTDYCDYYGSTWLELLPTDPDAYEHLDYWARLSHEGKMKRGWDCIRKLRSNPTTTLTQRLKSTGLL